MTMDLSKTSRLGVLQGENPKTRQDQDKAFKEKFSLEVQKEFEDKLVFKNLGISLPCSNSKGMEVPALSGFSTDMHQFGKPMEITGNVKHNRQLVLLDDIIYSQEEIAHIDQIKTQINFREHYTQGIGQALSKAFDQRCAAALLVGARRKDGITQDVAGGSVIKDKDGGTDPNKLFDMIKRAELTMSKNNVPRDSRYLVVRPEVFALLLENDKLLNRDFSSGADYAKGILRSVRGFKIIECNHLPNVVEKRNGDFNEYAGDFSKTLGVAFHKTGLTTLTHGGIKTALLGEGSEHFYRYKSTSIQSYYIAGHKCLRPDVVVELSA